ncbi:SurA N-terminal domain-containing protein [Streptomyces sp. NPDC090127]|uniref:SurA N-terminal domain-containing protein n=1 Tax=Streptomyces sp. NPDC090127 TaxID=3365953 RepID=UPI003801247A
MHRRTALSVSAALLAAAPLLAACGAEPHPGAAAVVGGERIEVSSLQAQVRDVRSAQEASPQAAQLIQATGDLSREKLNVMIFDRVVDKVAEENGITASRGEIQQTRDEFTKQSGGAEQLAATLLQQQGVAPDQIDGVVRRTVLMNKIAAKLSIANTPDGQKKLMDVFTAASKELDIDVNPRFGAWDDAKIQLGTFTAPWLRQISQEPAAVEAGA